MGGSYKEEDPDGFFVHDASDGDGGHTLSMIFVIDNRTSPPTTSHPHPSDHRQFNLGSKLNM